MTKENIITWVLLMILTVVSGLASMSSVTYIAPVIILLAILKFMGVTFNFMEMKKSNLVWKILIIGYLVIFCGIILVAL